MSEWVSVKTRLPDESGVYPACSIEETRRFPEDWIDALYRFNAEAKINENQWQHSSGFYDNGITHWMPLPEPPKDEQ